MNNTTSIEIEAYLNDFSYKHFIRGLPAFTVVCIICLLGCLGNILVFAVYLSHFPASSTRVFILAMSIVDFAMNTIGTPIGLWPRVFFFNFHYEGACAAVHGIQRLFVGTSVWLLGFVAFDRHRRVCYPFRKQMTPCFAVYLVIASVGLGSILTFPFVPLFGAQQVETEVDDIKGTMCGVKDEYMHTVYKEIEQGVNFATFLVVLAIMIVAYVRIGFHVRRAKRSLSRRYRNRQVLISSTATDNEHNIHLQFRCGEALEDIGYNIVIPITDDVTESDQSSGDVVRAQTSRANSRTSTGHLLFPRIEPINVNCENQLSFTELTDANSPALTKQPLPSKYLKMAETRITTAPSPTNCLLPVDYRGNSRTTLIMFVLTVLFVVNFLPWLSVA